MIDTLLTALEKLSPHFVASAIVDLKTGMPVVTYPKQTSVNIEAISAFYRDVVVATAKASRTVTDPPAVDELVLSHNDRIVVIRPMQNYSQMLLVVLSTACNQDAARKLIASIANSNGTKQ